MEENARLRRICGALIERVESAGMAGGAPYGAFEHAVLLAEQVRERTDSLHRTLEALGEANTRLEAARAEAEAANRSKTRFLAAVSHDLLQPLNAARLFTSALEDQGLPDDAGRLVGHIGRSLKDVEALLGTLVDISRLDAGVLTPDVATFPVGELLDVLAEEYRQLAGARGLDFHYVPSSAVVVSDLALLARVVRNFLTNAVRYTERGHLLLGCRRRPDGLEILVGDTGPGIPEAQQSAIFLEFRRAVAVPEGADRGLGLGLAIVDRIAGMLDHPLELVSRPGRGALFSIRVPYGRRPETPPAQEALPAGDPAGARIWVLDDDPAVLDGMAALLEGWGCRVHCASTPGELDATSRREGADLLLVDYHLAPGDPDGLEVADRLRDRHPALGVVVVTANHEGGLKQRVRERGYGCLLKPVKPLRLRMLLIGLLEGRSGA
ncbi:hybrid sensor histidine kinase/response regulator [Halomonas organivorans]